MSWHNFVNSSGLGSGLGSGLIKFPLDFMFQLKNQEVISLSSQFVISKSGRGSRRDMPYVFTEQGVAMLSSVLNSERER
ncbi:MAG: ORF6N domain-containing protein [Thermodesulfovibrionia bacterium]|nr:ORF6N domain-containing protein [Thermodesulfovibrionia bacterium]